MLARNPKRLGQLLLASLAAFAPLSAAQAQVLNFTAVAQEQDQWCWAGASRATLLFYREDIAQCALAELARTLNPTTFGAVDCCGDPSQGCNKPNSLYSAPGGVSDLLGHFRIAATGIARALTESEVAAELAAGHPFAMRWHWTYPWSSEGDGHILVGHGLSAHKLYYLDPWPGEGLKIDDYSWVVSATFSLHPHDWTHSLTTVSQICLGRDGAACDGGDLCHPATCQGGACVALAPVVCTSTACQTSVCNPATGQCDLPPSADLPCDDGNACTRTDTCQAGVCVGANPVLCTPLDSCHEAPCNPSTGECQSTSKIDGASCDDEDLCTQTDTCQGGVCLGANPVACLAPDDCHTASCSPSTGTCVSAAKADGTSCEDGDLCSTGDTCRSGTCFGGAKIHCAAPDACHLAACDKKLGQCVSTPVADGTNCPTGTCVAGLCQAPTTAAGCGCDSSGLSASPFAALLLWALRRRADRRSP